MLLTSAPPIAFHNEEIHSYEQYVKGNKFRFISVSGLLAHTMLEWFSGTLKEEPIKIGTLARQLKVVEQNEPLFRALLKILHRAGYVVETIDHVAKAQVDSNKLNQLVTGLKTDGADTYGQEEWLKNAIGASLDLSLACIPRLPELLRGETTGVQVLFSPENYNRSLAIYGAHLQEVYYGMIAERIVVHCHQIWDREPNKKINILEIGAGSGKGTVRMLEGLSGYEDKIRFCFSDIGNSFLRRAKKRFSSFECEWEFRLLDISEPPTEQGFVENDFDIIFATNVLHATANLRTTLTNAHRLLAPGGNIFVNEIVEDMAVNTVTYGMTSGWWLANDGLRLPLSPVATIPTYRSLLTEIGFDNLDVIGYPSVPEDEQVQAIIKGTKK